MTPKEAMELAIAETKARIGQQRQEARIAQQRYEATLEDFIAEVRADKDSPR